MERGGCRFVKASLARRLTESQLLQSWLRMHSVEVMEKGGIAECLEQWMSER